MGAWLTNQSGQITSFQFVYPSSIGDWKVVGTADLNGDGIGDLLLQNTANTQVGVWLMDGAGYPSSFQLVYPSNIGTWKVVGAVDLNHDGRPDILLQDGPSSLVGAWLMNASGLPYRFQLVSSANIGSWRVNGRP